MNETDSAAGSFGWLRHSGRFVAAALVGLALSLCLAGPIILGVWLVAVLVWGIGVSRKGFDPAIAGFMAGFSVLPCAFGIALLLESLGWSNAV
ncbi:hypothetical protein [Nocardia huaxiensis]|uniref:Uncharacterized protein n=1 Tax=Nocardia huaxiensis TaxID=2755382 RepID=A0A7D6Z0T2_9NOCA|nr:hypothetical protein [Nocardia huaxiensis]QLY29606.1 hypothetical protein H0264_30870 [Nocardia huaxiensis]UFS96821.1 hypothetical protein LPY97_02510 [Nocardia huaxiensis]